MEMKADDYDETRGVHAGWCRGCKQEKWDLSNDDGYCGDCN
tara:strand:+ start:266 stop:388 length:123 start_codon:yes stop_codon:yes gene_type:complete